MNGKGYKYFRRNCLFIFSDIYATDRMIIKAISDMQRKQKSVEKTFCKVFVLVPGDCFCFDLDKDSYKRYPIESETQVVQAYKARALVEKYEKI